MAKLAITIACENYDRVQPIRRGEVEISGCEINFLDMGPEELFFRAYRHREFDVAELSMSSYLLGTSRGTAPYVAVPVFLSRLFRHSAIYIRTDRGIDRPQDLKGRRIGLPEYQLTACLWARALLESEYGVAPWDVEWVRGGLHEPGRVEKVTLNLPPSVRISAIPEDTTLDAMLADGRIDALISPRPPRCFLQGQPGVARLFPDYKQVEQDYFRKTGIFPIMHVLGIRRDLVERHPWLANSVYGAFIKAKAMSLAALEDVAAVKAMLPWLGPHLEETRAVMGADFWPYGVEPNRATLEAMVRYAHRHGTADRELSVEELFVPSTLERYKV